MVRGRYFSTQGTWKEWYFSRWSFPFQPLLLDNKWGIFSLSLVFFQYVGTGRDGVFDTCSRFILTKASRGKRKARAQPEQCKLTVCLLALSLILSFLLTLQWVSDLVFTNNSVSKKLSQRLTGPCFFSPLGLAPGLLVLPPELAPTFPVFKNASMSSERNTSVCHCPGVHSLCFCICDEAAKFLSATTGSDICRERFKDDWQTRDWTGRMSNVEANYHLGTGGGRYHKDEFSEKFKTAPPPTHFRKITLQFFSEKPSLKPCIKVQNLQYIFLDWKWKWKKGGLFGTFLKIHPFW